MNWTQFLSGTPARDYIFQKIPYESQIEQALKLLKQSDFILIGAGAGLSTSAGLTYGGKRFTDNFGDFIAKYGKMYMSDMYSAGFYPFPTEEERWGYWSKHSMINRIHPESLLIYKKLYKLVEDKDHFVLTTNVDHQFWKAGFDDNNIFATQGDYGLIQCAKACHQKTYDAVKLFKQMDQARNDCKVPSYMIPKCPVCGGSMDMNLRKDHYFVEDGHWHQSAERYGEFLEKSSGKKVTLLELGVGFNTPTIIRFPFEKMMRDNKNYTLIRLNLDEALIPESFGNRAVGINADINLSIQDICRKIEE